MVNCPSVNVLNFCIGTMLFSIAYFTPSIVQSLGYTSSRAQLMSVPPFVVSFFSELNLRESFLFSNVI